MGRLLNKLTQTCPECRERHFPRRVVGHYIDEPKGAKVFLWECKHCQFIWIERLWKAPWLKKRMAIKNAIRERKEREDAQASEVQLNV